MRDSIRPSRQLRERRAQLRSALRICANSSHGTHPELEATVAEGAPPMLRERADNPSKRKQRQLELN